ncbi:hypothetical protein [Treponema saccharophilum]|uniref:Uncharacterized protein n=1 Tax=Treponema saccharophilum DSM 2985 TaxID=907348 RepID=H7EKG9_9SPIR|nr:hypothetical protein [Treponema saccharophilum]EIC01874.1 hypothetical protein TresaDRAFT_1626 [Treponema saccharophilum DSM 2985]BDC97523.1 hypothetical protein TRSA_26220 [Treponema saccharophilum]
MLGDFDIDIIVNDEDFWKEKDEPDESDLEPDEEIVKTDNLIHDALHKNLVHLEKYDLDQCFGNECPHYFEADTIAEVLDYVKKMRIKAILIFVGGNPQMSEVQEAVDAIKPYCTAECIDRPLRRRRRATASGRGIMQNTDEIADAKRKKILLRQNVG